MFHAIVNTNSPQRNATSIQVQRIPTGNFQKTWTQNQNLKTKDIKNNTERYQKQKQRESDLLKFQTMVLLDTEYKITVYMFKQINK